MSIYVIGDLHLSFSQNKPMDIFGKNWEKHEEKIKQDWIEKVKENDLVLLPGDFSWATYLEDTYLDFKYLNDLPGKKVLLKGNHDYWWTTITSMKKYLEDNEFKNIEFLYNNSIEYEDKVFVGTRGWSFQETENSKKMINRENQRLELSIQDAINKSGNSKEIIALMHYPPLIEKQLLENNHLEFFKTLKKYDIKKCYYGHLHGKSHADAVIGNIEGIEFNLVSADYLNFKLLNIS
ncbi:MAG: metallophosphoesterase [Clostridia bacterium]|nr:metallophosphoesterase [Clostridia bacterium]